MVVIIISTGFQKIQNILSEFDYIHVIKRKGIQLFLYYDIEQTQGKDVVRWTQRKLAENMGKGYVIQIFSILNGKIDFFSDLPEEKRNNMSYYNSFMKDLTDKEMEAFFAKNPQIQNRSYK